MCCICCICRFFHSPFDFKGDLVPVFNLYEEFWKIYTKSDVIPPQFISENSVIEKSIIGEGSEIYGKVYNSVIGSGVIIEDGCEVYDSIIMNGTIIGKNTKAYKAIIADNVSIGENVILGDGEEVENVLKPDIYNFGLVTIGENSVIPSNVSIGKNTAISGITVADDYDNNCLAGGHNILKAGER